MATDSGSFVIDLHHVEKVYRGRVRALAGIEMRVHPGEIFGLLGPNGAGKSTLVKIMMTVVRPTRAAGTLLGRPIGHKGTLAKVGYLPEHHRFPRYLTGRQVLDFYGALAKVGRAQRRSRADHLLELVGMKDWQHKKISAYSKGMMQRVGLAQALINDPKLVLLDEPTDGVDPVGRREIRDLLVRLRGEGKTIFLNSHLLSELEMVCDRVAILVQGKVVQQGTLDELTRDSQRYEIVIHGEVPERLRGHKRIDVRPGDNGRSTLIIHGADPEPVQPIIDQLRIDEVTIVSIRPVRESLEDLFMRAVIDPATGKAHKPGAAAPTSAPPTSAPPTSAPSAGGAA
ncbi:MAG: ABC transporter ATP-binding protein [Phycisphaeraceae bacterium]|nr:MAG: ABC transporter ATP-binding protein [Phycisphaeraceae bacterium]